VTRFLRVIIYWSREVDAGEECYEVECSVRPGVPQPHAPGTGWVPGDGEAEVQILTARDFDGPRPDIVELLQAEHAEDIRCAALDAYADELEDCRPDKCKCRHGEDR